MTRPTLGETSVNGALRLADWGLIRVSGSDARSFLHSQLTQDLQGLPAGRAALAGYCSAKGRLLATFIVWSPSPDEFLLACSADLLAPTLKRLSMFVLRAKCKLSDASQELPLWGLTGEAAAGWFGNDLPHADWQIGSSQAATVVRLPAAVVGGETVPRYLVVSATPPPPELATLDETTWRALEVHSGVGRVVAATVDQFVPQMLNLELVGGVSFSKGCYPGQEIVARSQYRGTLKRRAFVLTASEALAPGSEVFHTADPEQPAGMVALSGRLPGHGPSALVELKLSALEGGELRAGSANGPALQLSSQPYPVPLPQ